MLKRIIFGIDNIINKIIFFLFPTKTGKGCIINGIINRRGRGIVSIGDRVKINSSQLANPLGGSSKTTICALPNGIIKVGNDVGISNSVLIARELIEIEDGVLIGADVKIYDNDFHSLDYRDRGGPNDVPKTKPVIIKKNAFVGAHSIILKGVTIGERSIIGAGSVVVNSIPDDEIWGGNPARLIRKQQNACQ